MSDKTWFVHISGDSLGPLSTKLMQKMIQQGRLHADDFAGLEGASGWKRLGEIKDFSSCWGAAPTIAVPQVEAVVEEEASPDVVVVEAEEEAEPEPEPEPAPKPKPAPKAAPAPKVVAKPAPEKAAAAAPKPAPKVEKPAPPPKPAPKPLQGVVTIGNKMFKIVQVQQAALLIEASGDLEEGSELSLKISGDSFPKAFEMKALLTSKENVAGQEVYRAEFVRPNPAHKRVLAPYVIDSDQE